MVTLGIVLGSVLLSLAGQGTRDLGPPPYLRAYYPTWSLNLATGDLDGDGDTDLIDCQSSDLLVLWNSGAGWIESTQSLGVPAHSAAIGDVDGDGAADIVVVSDDELRVLLGDGLGGFTALAPVRLVDPATDLLLADLDGDGALDAIVVSKHSSYPDQGSFQVLLGDGQGGFTAGTFTAPIGEAVGGALGDLDEDGNLDLVTDPGQQLFFGDGQGGFTVGGALGIYGTPWCRPHLADFDGDGHLDLLTLDTAQMTLCFGDGQGAFSAGTSYGGGPDVALGDLDGDGDVDVVSKSSEGLYLRVWLNDGSGTLVNQGGQLTWLGPGAGADEVVMADLDGDGDQDIAVGSWAGLTLLPGDGTGWFVLPPQLPGVKSAYVEVADLDRDGNQDIVCQANGVTSFLGDGQGGFGAPLATTLGDIGRISLGDLDEDGILDLATNGGGAALICLGDGAGRFGQVKRYLKDLGAGSAAIADIDGDGHLDVAYSCDTFPYIYSIHLLFGDGHGGFTDSSFLVSEPLEQIALGDVNGDKKVDVVAVAYKKVLVYLGDGAGGFGPETSYSTQFNLSGLGIADLDQDGWPEILFGQYWASGVWVLWGQPGGGHAPPEQIESSGGMPAPHDFALADVEGDGTAELLVAYEGFEDQAYPGGVGILRRTGPREFTWAWSVGHASGPWSVAVGDLDQDGRLDLVSGANHIYVDPYGGGTYEVPGPVEVLLNQLPPEAPCTSEVTYCVAKLNSAGCLPRICSSGTPTLSGPDDFVVSAERVMSHRPGLMIWGFAAGSLPFQDGTLCIGGAITRTILQSSGGTTGVYDCSGTYAWPFTQAYMISNGLTASTQVFAQYWSRDVGQPPPIVQSGLTDALSFTILP